MDGCNLQYTYVFIPDPLQITFDSSCMFTSMSESRSLYWYVDERWSLTEFVDFFIRLAPNNCSCQFGYNGTRCEIRKYFRSLIDRNVPNVFSFIAICTVTCNNGGMCISADTCNCTNSWSGNQCNIPRCNPICLNGGKW